MKRSNLFFAVLALLLIWVATSSTRAQSRIPQHLVRERGVRRVRAFDGRTLSVVSQQASDQYLTNNPAASMPQSMKVDLFDGTSVTVNVDRVEQQSENSRAWYGKIE